MKWPEAFVTVGIAIAFAYIVTHLNLSVDFK